MYLLYKVYKLPLYVKIIYTCICVYIYVCIIPGCSNNNKKLEDKLYVDFILSLKVQQFAYNQCSINSS